MEKIKKLIRKDMILYRMIAVFSMVSTLVILLVTTVIFGLLSAGMKNEIYRSQVQNLKQISNSVSFRAEYVNSLMLQAKEDEQISKLFYTDDDSVVGSIKHRMDDFRAPVKQLNSIYIYNEYSDRIYYSGENKLPFVNTTTSFEDRGFVEILNNIGAYPKYTPILRKISVEWPVGRTYETYVFTYLIYDSYASGTVKNIMAFNFHLGWMDDALNFITTGQNISEKIWIINSDRQIVYTNTGELIGVTCEPDVLSDDIFEKESGYFFDGFGREREMIVYATPSRVGYDSWTFISWNDYATLINPIEQVRRTVYLFCGIVFLLSLLVIFRLSHVLYEPVRKTINRVKTLEKENEKKARIERNVYLRKLFLGDIPDDINIIRQGCDQQQIDSDLGDYIQVILLSVDNAGVFQQKYADRFEQVCDQIEVILRNHFQKYFGKLLCARMHNSSWAVCIPANKDTVGNAMRFDELSLSLQEKLGITVSMSVSSVGHSIRDIPYLYSEAVNIQTYRFLWGKSYMITYEDVRRHGQSKFEYPSDTEKRLLSHLFAGKYTEAMEDYEEFTAEVRNFTVEEIRLSYMLLAYSVKTASQKAMAEAAGMLVEYDLFYKKIQTAEVISEVHELYGRLIREITDKLKKSSKERHEVLIGQIEEYVEQHYGNISLSMNEISDHVNMSAAYLGRLYKQVTGNTFSEYLTRFRLSKACALLRSTNLTVNEISDQVGFTNSSYFYIIFKKNLECTPNQYRRQAAGENGE